MGVVRCSMPGCKNAARVIIELVSRKGKASYCYHHLKDFIRSDCNLLPGVKVEKTAASG